MTTQSIISEKSRKSEIKISSDWQSGSSAYLLSALASLKMFINFNQGRRNVSNVSSKY